MSKHRNHVDRRRNLIGNAMSEERTREIEKLNRSSPVYTVSSHTGQRYEIYNPNAGKGKRAKPGAPFP